QSIAYAAERIMVGSAEAIIAGGVESMSMVPMMGNVLRPNAKLAETAPQYYMSMGHTAEQVATQYGMSRADQDAFAVRSHEKAAAAIEKGHFVEEIVPVEVTKRFVDENNKYQEKSFMFEMDEGVRHGTTVQTLDKLRAAFSARGTVTAGNSSQ